MPLKPVLSVSATCRTNGSYSGSLSTSTWARSVRPSTVVKVADPSVSMDANPASPADE